MKRIAMLLALGSLLVGAAQTASALTITWFDGWGTLAGYQGADATGLVEVKNGGSSWEYAIRPNGATGSMAVNADFAFGSNQPVDFLLEVNAVTGEIKYTLAGGTISWISPNLTGNGVDTMEIVAKSSNPNWTSYVLDSVYTDGVELIGVGGLVSSNGSNGVNGLRLEGIGCTSFQVRGSLNFSWTGAFPSDAGIEAFFSLGPKCDAPVVPEPATLALLSLGLGGLGVIRRRRA